jgi:sucrose-6-phosphate hydrolase SacC (GH32 family)
MNPDWMTFRATVLCGLVVVGRLATSEYAVAADDLLIADFEGIDYGEWQVTGTAFGTAPAQGTLPGQMAVEGFVGTGLVNSFLGGDGATGELVSPPFTIERPYLKFLIGGGRDSDRLAIRLLIDGQVKRSATGPNSQPGGHETLSLDAWDVRDLMGQQAQLQIVDQATGGWGHLNIDQIMQTTEKPVGLRRDATRTIKISSRYLLFPIGNGVERRAVTVRHDGNAIVRNEIELAVGEPDWWAVMDVEDWSGKTLEIVVEHVPDNLPLLDGIENRDQPIDAQPLYQESLRGQFHFSPQRGWNNDPNGLAYYEGEYHLFFQHNPYGWSWGNMHWGHAVSRDLVHWEELGDVRWPDSLGPMFSGSAVVDWHNTSGLSDSDKPPLVLIYTAAGSPTTQCLASSVDGRSFTKFAGNPIIDQITSGNRDPKVIWHEPTQRWVMVLYVELPSHEHSVHFFTSPNLREWTLASVTKGLPGSRYLFECPDFFALPVDGDPADRQWVLMAADSQYAVGSFDGQTFIPQTEALPGHRGRGFYAAQTFSDIPASDGRRIQIGWFQTETKGMPFNQSMTIPLELRLLNTPEGPRISWQPVAELQALREDGFLLDGLKLAPKQANPLADFHAELAELRIEFVPQPGSQLQMVVRGIPVEFDADSQQIRVHDVVAPAPLRDGRQQITVFADRTGLEVFASDGLTYVPFPVNLDRGQRSYVLEASGTSIEIGSLAAYPLRSIWGKRP